MHLAVSLVVFSSALLAVRLAVILVENLVTLFICAFGCVFNSAFGCVFLVVLLVCISVLTWFKCVFVVIFAKLKNFFNFSKVKNQQLKNEKYKNAPKNTLLKCLCVLSAKAR